MAINVLQYNQLARSIDAKKDQIAEQRLFRDSSDALKIVLDDSIGNLDLLIDSAQNWTAGSGVGFGDQDVQGKRAAYLACPFDCIGWQNIPCFTDITGVAGTSFCVWDTACTDFNYGFCCNWVVPAGVTVAMFEVWGAGGASGAGNCCGGHPFGQNGSFAQTIINVKEGDDFMLCAGCAIKYCSYCTQSCVSQSCPSFVCASNLGAGSDQCFCICARGGCHNLCIQMQERTDDVRCAGVVCSTSSHGLYRYWFSCACICGSGSNYCADGSMPNCCYLTDDRLSVPHWPSKTVVADIQTTDGSIKVCNAGTLDYLVPGMWPGGQMNSAGCGCHCNPGVPRWDGSCQSCFGAAYCCGYQARAACGIRCFPGHGGAYSWICGGGTGLYSDYGRQGGIRVTYC